MAKPAFKYKRRERTVEDIRRKASEGSRDYDNLLKGDIKMFKPAEGENIIRIMPPTWGFGLYTDAELDKMSKADVERLEAEEEKYGNGWDLPIYVHYGVGPDNASYLCRAKMLENDRCPICDAKARTRDPDEADKLSPTKRGLAWIIDRNSEKDGPQVWSMPFSKIRNEIYARSIDKKHGTPIIVDDIDEGFDIIFNRAGKDDRTNYTAVEVDRDATPLHDDEAKQDKWLAYIIERPLQEILNFYDVEHIEKVLGGRESSRRRGGDEADAEDAPSARAGRRGLRRPVRSVDGEEADYMAEDASEEGGAVDAPAGRGRRGATRPVGGRAADEEDAVSASTRRVRGGSPAAASVEEPDDEDAGGDDASARSRRPLRGGRGSPAPAEEEGAEDDGDATPTEQARSRLRSMRDRRGR